VAAQFADAHVISLDGQNASRSLQEFLFLDQWCSAGIGRNTHVLEQHAA
jgi:hypothetical protein